MMTKKSLPKHKSQIQRTADSKGKSIEEEIRQAVATKAPIETTAPEIYTPLKDGILPQYDIRTDRQELALDAIDKFAKSEILHADEKLDEPETEPENIEKNE